MLKLFIYRIRVLGEVWMSHLESADESLINIFVRYSHRVYSAASIPAVQDHWYLICFEC